MPATIEFYGLCLFVWESDQVRVLLPSTDENADGGKDRHEAWFLDRTDSDRIFQAKLDHTTVTFAETESAGRPQLVDIRDVIRLDKLAGAMTLRDTASLFRQHLLDAEVILRGGRLDVLERAPGEINARAYGFIGSGHSVDRPSCVVRWTAPGEKLTCTLRRHGHDGETTHPHVTDSARRRRLVIGNVCKAPDPMTWKCEPTKDCRDLVIDHDFGWYYRLFDGVPHVQPLPVADCSKLPKVPGNRAGTTSTCYNGGWCPPGGCD